MSIIIEFVQDHLLKLLGATLFIGSYAVMNFIPMWAVVYLYVIMLAGFFFGALGIFLEA